MIKLALLAFALPLVADLFDRFIAWARQRWQVAVHRHCPFPPFRLVLWARIESDDAAYDHDLFVVKLPSWEWAECDYGRRWCWHRRHVYRRGRRNSYDSGFEGPHWGVELVPE